MARPRIGFLGPAPLTNGYTAAGRFLRHLTGLHDPWPAVIQIPLPSHPEIVRAITSDQIDYGIIAVENTLDGIIIESIRELERLFESDPPLRPWVCWEELLAIRHLLINRSGRLGDIRRIATHPSAQRQCSRFLHALQQALGASLEITPVKSTGDGARMAAEEPHVAALASQEAMQAFAGALRTVDLSGRVEGRLIWQDLETLTDFRNGLTRFWVLSTKTMPGVPASRVSIPIHDPRGNISGTEDHHLQKTCFLLNLPDQPGFMHRALGAFASREINVAAVYPYPRLERSFEYLYFVEIEGHGDDPLVVEAQQQVNEGMTHLPLHQRACIRLGSYPNTTFLHRHPALGTSFLPRAAAALRSTHRWNQAPSITAAH